MARFKDLAAALSTGVCIVALATPAQAQDRSFNVPSGPLRQALDAYVTQSGNQLIYRPEDLGNAKSKGVTGMMPARSALERVLAGTGFKAVSDPSGALAIVGNALAGGPTAGNELASSSGEDGGSDQAGISEILVVGSRSQNVDIRRTENDPQPYVVFGREEIKRSSAINLDEFLQQRLTSNTTYTRRANASQNGLTAGPRSGINLRGLGENETLILVNGRRVAGINILDGVGQPDINGIPLSAVERVEVLSSSASAIYGGAAVGGVVNIITKRDYNGGELDYSVDKPLDSHAIKHRLSANYGFTFWDGKTQVMLGASYTKSKPLLLEDRADVADRRRQRAIDNAPDYVVPPGSAYEGGAPNIVSQQTVGIVPPGSPGIITCIPGLFCIGILQPNLTLKPAYGGAALGSVRTWVPAGTSPGDPIGAVLLTNAGTQNLDRPPTIGINGLLRPLGTTQHSDAFSASIRQKLFGSAELFVDLARTDNTSEGPFNPFEQAFQVSASAPTNPFNQAVSVYSPNNFTAKTKFKVRTNTGSVGFVMPLVDKWRLEADYTRSVSKYQVRGASADTSALTAALNSGAINPFVDLLEHPVDFSPYVVTNQSNGKSTIDDAMLRSSGTLFHLPGGNASLTVGLGFRREAIGLQRQVNVYPITTTLSNRFVVYPSSQSIVSAYGEARLPIIGPANNAPMFNALELQLAIRSEWFFNRLSKPAFLLFRGTTPEIGPSERILTDYNSTNPTIALKYNPIRQIALRASYATGFLPPTASQLTPNLGSLCPTGPCLSITDPVLGQTYLVNAQDAGNLNLKPQRSKSWNLGVIVEPFDNKAGRLRLSADWYNIVQPNYIIKPTQQLVLSDPAFSGRITRDPTTGRVTLLDLSYTNATRYQTKGIDLALDYDANTSVGDFTFHGAATKIFEDKRQFAINSPLLDYAGRPGEGGPIKFKANGTLNWNYGGWNASWSAIYYGSHDQVYAPGSPAIARSGSSAASALLLQAQGGSSIPSQIYHDVYLDYEFPDHASTTSNGYWRFLAGTRISLSIKNLFNKVAPSDAFIGAPFYSSPLGDIALRTVRVAIRKKI